MECLCDWELKRVGCSCQKMPPHRGARRGGRGARHNQPAKQVADLGALVTIE